MNKYVKIGVGVFFLFLILGLIYYFFKPTPVTWTAKPGGDVSGSQYDIETNMNNMSLVEAKAYAEEIGAASFLFYPPKTIFKNAKTPVSTTSGAAWSLYVRG